MNLFNTVRSVAESDRSVVWCADVQETEWAPDELRVTCLLCTASCLWVGTADGTLLIYDVTASHETNALMTDCVTPAQTKTVSDQLTFKVDRRSMTIYN